MLQCNHLLKLNPIFQMIRCMGTSEALSHLRPFYFSVHPDLFGQHPEQRRVNEDSLKMLSSYLTNLEQSRVTSPVGLVFYLRPPSLKKVNFKLGAKDVGGAVREILQACDLPTNTLPKTSRVEKKRKIFPFTTSENVDLDEISRDIKYKVEVDNDLRAWLTKNYPTAMDYLRSGEAIRKEVERLKLALIRELDLHEIVWDCGWNISHFRGALQSLQTLNVNHPREMRSIQGKTLIFGTNTGVNLDGDIMLNCGEVRNNWLDVIKNLQREEKVLVKLPAWERALSRVLRDIQVVHRKFQPKVMAGHYEAQLKRLVTSLSDYQGMRGLPKSWPVSLSKFELVVETEAGPLMVSPTGQFIVPSSCPAFLLVQFLTENLKKAQELLNDYQQKKGLEHNLSEQVKCSLKLTNLGKDDHITPDLMVPWCQRILENQTYLAPSLHGASIFVTSYYSLLSDGVMCVPHNCNI